MDTLAQSEVHDVRADVDEGMQALQAGQHVGFGMRYGCSERLQEIAGLGAWTVGVRQHQPLGLFEVVLGIGDSVTQIGETKSKTVDLDIAEKVTSQAFQPQPPKFIWGQPIRANRSLQPAQFRPLFRETSCEGDTALGQRKWQVRSAGRLCLRAPSNPET